MKWWFEIWWNLYQEVDVKKTSQLSTSPAHLRRVRSQWLQGSRNVSDPSKSKAKRKTYEQKDMKDSVSDNLTRNPDIRVYTQKIKKGSDFAVWKSPSTSNKIFHGSRSNFNHVIWLSSLQAMTFSSWVSKRFDEYWWKRHSYWMSKRRDTHTQNCIRLPSGLWLWVLLPSAPPTSYTDLSR